LDILIDAASQKDEQKSQEILERSNWEANKQYVENFFKNNEENYWLAIQVNFAQLQTLYSQIREKRLRLSEETSEEIKNAIKTEIQETQRLIDYRRKRFSALEYEAKRRDAEKQPNAHENQFIGTNAPQSAHFRGPIEMVTGNSADHVDTQKDRPKGPIEIVTERAGDTVDTPKVRPKGPIEILTGKSAGQPTEEEPMTRGEHLLNRVKSGQSTESITRGDELEIMKNIKFIYMKEHRKFKLEFDDTYIRRIELTPQIGYILGFEFPTDVTDGEIAKYSCDLSGGINSFCVYANGLTENIIMGDQLASLLRVVAVTSKSGKYFGILVIIIE
jgi:hypothetical protein